MEEHEDGDAIEKSSFFRDGLLYGKSLFVKVHNGSRGKLHLHSLCL